MVLHPDEVHNGEAGSEAGFHYRMIYVEPALVRDALGASARALPFVKQAVFKDARLFQAVDAACSNLHSALDPICLDEIITLLADGLLAKDPAAHGATSVLIDARAAGLARNFLEANLDRVVTSEELEAITGLDRYALSRHFRRAYGTSPYRYLTMRRLDRVRKEIAQGAGLAEAALATGFSDQAHMSRQFKASYGLSPGRWQQLAYGR